MVDSGRAKFYEGQGANCQYEGTLYANFRCHGHMKRSFLVERALQYWIIWPYLAICIHYQAL